MSAAPGRQRAHGRATDCSIAADGALAARAAQRLRSWRAARRARVATMIQNFSWNQTSHYDLIRALDNGGTTIDAYQANTGDKVFYKGHCYSARAPGLALFALPFYDTLNLGRRRRAGRANRQALRNEDEMIYLIGLWGNVLPGAAAAAARVARRRALRARLRRGRRRSRSASARWCCRSRRCCSRTSSPRCSASPRSR